MTLTLMMMMVLMMMMLRGTPMMVMTTKFLGRPRAVIMSILSGTELSIVSAVGNDVSWIRRSFLRYRGNADGGRASVT